MKQRLRQERIEPQEYCDSRGAGKLVQIEREKIENNKSLTMVVPRTRNEKYF
jgi:hypothetical protein